MRSDSVISNNYTIKKNCYFFSLFRFLGLAHLNNYFAHFNIDYCNIKNPKEKKRKEKEPSFSFDFLFLHDQNN